MNEVKYRGRKRMNLNTEEENKWICRLKLGEESEWILRAVDWTVGWNIDGMEWKHETFL